uniref:Uncharacterized protein n=1 Tax=Candidatus Kentrum sp. FM TaxID=2126340 RepID=A0A450THI1_9GAMM|nr:MAG: hypothetical protein BECKFM1743A_GA0114220_104194 [Candidatus Kentron sp. FM]VFJ66601.1 MAG: hypothetical protein BECKFM1743C_GA0114222_104304 [Candidatus Kentron sp. FM]VFK16462.1 MAG: hypothetical protein BECKFM1743B_GA0114221_104194 [Candidatus Kentron sp. FM]
MKRDYWESNGVIRIRLGEERNVHAILSTKGTEREERFFNHRGHSAAEPQPKCLNFEEVNHKDTKARRETLDL